MFPVFEPEIISALLHKSCHEKQESMRVSLKSGAYRCRQGT